MKTIRLALAFLLATASSAAAGDGQSAAAVVKSLFQENQPFNRHVQQVAYLNVIDVACGLENERIRKAHGAEFAAAEADIGKDAVGDQLYLLWIQQANFLLPAGAHERFCSEALAIWGT